MAYEKGRKQRKVRGKAKGACGNLLQIKTEPRGNPRFFVCAKKGRQPLRFYQIMPKSHIINGIVAMDSRVVIAKSSAA